MSRDGNANENQHEQDSSPHPENRLNRRRFITAASATGALALAGCMGGGDGGDGGDGGNGGDSGSSGEPQSGGTLNWGGSVPVQTLDPHLESAAASARVLENITEGLLTVDWEYNLQPDLAKSWETSEDNTKLTFELREGVKFHNGEEMTSADVLASLERVANGKQYLAHGYFENVDSMKAPDDYTFEITLTEPFAPFLARMATSEMHVVPEAQAQQDQIKEPIGTGPFQFESMEIESEFVMTKFEDYWGEPALLDKVVKKEVSDASVRLQSFQAGELDFINDVPPKDVQSVKSQSNTRFETTFPKALVYMGLNCNREPFDDKHARLALDFAIDKAEVAEAALYGTGKPAATPAAPGSPWENTDLEPRPKDLEKAKEHLSQSAYPDGYTATFKIPEPYAAQVTAAKIIQDSVSEIGINLEIQKIPWSLWLSDVYSKQDFQATTSSYLALWYPDVSYYKFLHPNGAYFFTGWENDEYNTLVEDARRIYDTDKRAEKYHRAAEILQEERAGHLFLFWQANLFAADSSYQGKIGAPDGSTLRFEDNWLDQ
ncbi:ABC transporter substrate-binding protein [Haladaptatus sp. CMSO5]|uniref:ABC transporter substrate-binding protein n=1 Tax=Haladaptatus sp. CMSO5 TaxID=3120514 RepID=UPI002FCDEDE7